jgi:hypothetical protein
MGGNDKEYSYFEIFLSPEALLEEKQWSEICVPLEIIMCGGDALPLLVGRNFSSSPLISSGFRVPSVLTDFVAWRERRNDRYFIWFVAVYILGYRSSTPKSYDPAFGLNDYSCSMKLISLFYTAYEEKYVCLFFTRFRTTEPISTEFGMIVKDLPAKVLDVSELNF